MDQANSQSKVPRLLARIPLTPKTPLEDRLHWKVEDGITSANLDPSDPIAESFPRVGGGNREPG